MAACGTSSGIGCDASSALCKGSVEATALTVGAVVGLFLIAARAGVAAPQGPSEGPLHKVIDTIVAAEAVGPVANRCSDADFVRRIHLDLAGVIPTVATVRSFLANSTADKRTQLIDTLLDDQAFARHMMFVLDAMLLERMTPPGELAASWREYLFTALVGDQPLDEVAREVLVSDGGDPATRPATAFLITRNAEPVQLTRAIGRLFFGRDLQCAQCHDHPLDDDIRQAEHQGLFAFVARTSLFKGKDNALRISEKADGEVSYESVFTNDGEKGVWPRLPGGFTFVDELRPEPSAAYTTAPSKTAHGVPAYSRRAALATRLVDDHLFRRNLANRIWAIFFGQGLVHPLDAFGAENPPSHPRLLGILADALRDCEFRLRPFVREIVLSETYQRSVDPPQPLPVESRALDGLITRLETEQKTLTSARAALENAAADAEARLETIATEARAVHLERLAVIAARDSASTACDAASAAAATAQAALDTAGQVSASVSAAAAQAAKAAMAVPGDGALESLAAMLAAQAAKRAAAAEGAAKAHAEKRAAAEVAEGLLATAREAVEAVATRLAVEPLAAAEREAIERRLAAADASHQVRRLEERLQLARDLLSHAALIGTDRPAAAVAWESIVDRWTRAGQVAPLRALSPEQLALSVQQATGALAARQASAAAAVDKEPPEQLAKASGDERSEIRSMQVEMRMVKDAAGLLRSAAELFGDSLTEGFQASVNQALYFGNAADIQGQLAPSGQNLVATLATMSDASAVADEAYCAVLSRLPTAEERADVAAFLAPRSADRPVALSELVWALVSSNEFRFNH
jgi:hypothetical protein